MGGCCSSSISHSERLTKNAIYHFIHPNRGADVYDSNNSSMFYDNPLDNFQPSVMDTHSIHTVPYIDPATKQLNSSSSIECDILFALMFYQINRGAELAIRGTADPALEKNFQDKLSGLIKRAAEEVQSPRKNNGKSAPAPADQKQLGLDVFRILRITGPFSGPVTQQFATSTLSLMLLHWKSISMEAFRKILEHVKNHKGLPSAKFAKEDTLYNHLEIGEDVYVEGALRMSALVPILFAAAEASLVAAKERISTHTQLFEMFLDYDFELKTDKKNILHHLALLHRDRDRRNVVGEAEAQKLHDMLTSLISSGKITPDMITQRHKKENDFSSNKTPFVFAIQFASKMFITELIASKIYCAESDFENGLLAFNHFSTVSETSDAFEVASLLWAMNSSDEDKVGTANRLVRSWKMHNIPINASLKKLFESKGVTCDE